MAELNGTSEALPLDNSHIAREATANEDTLMRDGEATPLTREPPTAKPLTETQQPADTHGTQTAPMTAPSTEAPISEMPPPAPSTPSLAAPEGFTADDLAMQRNPMITADASMVDSESIRDAVQPPPDYSQHEENTCVPEIPQETSVTGWLVPPPESEASTLAEPTTSTKPSIPAESSPSTAIAATRQSRISFEDYLTLSEITFEWGDSYDDKDWMRLRAILAPTLMVDYTEVNGHKWDSMPAEDFVGIMSHIGFVGDPLVHTQHHIGASKWQKISEDEVIGHHQLRAAHQRYTSRDLRVVENKGHGHAMVKHVYRKVGGEWKLAGLRPTVRWNEFEFEKIFKGF